MQRLLLFGLLTLLPLALAPALDAEPDSRGWKDPALEGKLEGLEGKERFDVLYLWLEENALYPWLEKNPGGEPPDSFRYGEEAVALLSEEIEPMRAYKTVYWAAQIAWHRGDADLAAQRALHGVEIARELGSTEHESDALTVLAAADRSRGRAREAVVHAQRLVELAGTPKHRARALNSLALAYRELADLPRALDAYLAALQICLELPRDEMLGTLLANIGRVKALLGHLEEAIVRTEEALVALKAEGLDQIAAHVLYNLGSYEMQLERYEDALGHFEESLSTLERLGEESKVSIFLASSMAVALASLNRPEEALKRAHQALDLAKIKGNDHWLLNARTNYGHTLQKLGRFPEARQQFLNAQQLADALGDGFPRVKVLEHLAEVHEELADYPAAIADLRRANQLRSQLVDEENQRHFAEWRARLETAETESKLATAELAREIQEAELRQQRTQRNALSFIVVLLVFSGYGAFSGYRRQRQSLIALAEAHEQLRAKKQKLEKALSQVNLLSGMLPICSHCKSIRDDEGYWQRVEAYITDHSEAKFSHGICPACVQSLYPELGEAPDDEQSSEDPD